MRSETSGAAVTIPTDNLASIELEELVQFLNEQIDVNDPESLCSAAPMLRALSNNRTFLADLIAAELGQPDQFQLDNSYFSRALILSQQEGYAIRAAIWTPADAEESQPAAVTDDGSIVSLGNSIYGLSHNHAFPFPTVGYWGPGYLTDIYECAADGGNFALGDKVEFRFLERTDLPVGKVMYYREFLDVHTQYAPESLSISLNILVNNPEQTLNDQHDFELTSGRVASVVGKSNDARVGLCQFAGAVGDQTTFDLLSQIAQKHPSQRVRSQAASAAQACRSSA